MRFFTLVLFAAACTPDDAALDAFTAELELPTEQLAAPGTSGGCDDLTLFRTNGADTMAVSVYAPRLLQDTVEQGDGYASYTLDLQTTMTSVYVQMGSDMSERYCADVAVAMSPVDSTWQVVEGEIVLDVYGAEGTSSGYEGNVSASIYDGVARNLRTGQLRAIPAIHIQPQVIRD